MLDRTIQVTTKTLFKSLLNIFKTPCSSMEEVNAQLTVWVSTLWLQQCANTSRLKLLLPPFTGAVQNGYQDDQDEKDEFHLTDDRSYLRVQIPASGSQQSPYCTEL